MSLKEQLKEYYLQAYNYKYLLSFIDEDTNEMRKHIIINYKELIPYLMDKALLIDKMQQDIDINIINIVNILNSMGKSCTVEELNKEMDNSIKESIIKD